MTDKTRREENVTDKIRREDNVTDRTRPGGAVAASHGRQPVVKVSFNAGKPWKGDRKTPELWE